jgi:hypothetical protein
VVGGGHHDFSAEGKDGVADAVVVGGDEEVIELRAAEAAFPNVLDKRFSGQDVEGLSGEAGGPPAGWEDADEVEARGRGSHGTLVAAD